MGKFFYFFSGVGMCIPVYLLARLVHYAFLRMEDTGHRSEAKGKLLLWGSVALYGLSFPVVAIMHLANRLHEKRQYEQHLSNLRFVRDVATAYATKSSEDMKHCCGKEFSSPREFDLWVEAELKRRGLEDDIHLGQMREEFSDFFFEYE